MWKCCIISVCFFLSITTNATEPKSGFSGVVSSYFDRSANGYGWYLGYNRKIQVNHDPVSGQAIGSNYRQLNTVYGTGTIGGITGNWEGTSSNNISQTVYSQSLYQSSGTIPGGRYPSSSEFIKGYYFGLFNDMNTFYSGTVSQAMFTVCDAREGWNLPVWSTPKRIEAVLGGATPPAAWQGLGDVVYNQNDGYYYWMDSTRKSGQFAKHMLNYMKKEAQCPQHEGSTQKNSKLSRLSIF